MHVRSSSVTFIAHASRLQAKATLSPATGLAIFVTIGLGLVAIVSIIALQLN
jgi:hypothetical protein